MHLEHQLNEPQAHVKVYWTDFLKTLMDFQMRQHETYLRAFTKIFRRVDTDSDGIVNEEQFNEMLANTGLDLDKDTVRYFLQVLDPCNL